MRLTCPSCHAEVSLEALLESEAARLAVARLAQRSLPFGALLLRYVALFRPAKRRLSIERMVSLVEELLPDIERCAITRKGREWQAPHAAWQQALETVLAARDKGSLTLPLTTHGYLYEVLLAMADKAEGQAEREAEQSLRSRAATHGAQPLAAVLAAPAAPAGPSLYARRLQAEMAARSRADKTADDEGGVTP